MHIGEQIILIFHKGENIIQMLHSAKICLHEKVYVHTHKYIADKNKWGLPVYNCSCIKSVRRLLWVLQWYKPAAGSIICPINQAYLTIIAKRHKHINTDSICII